MMPFKLCDPADEAHIQAALADVRLTDPEADEAIVRDELLNCKTYRNDRYQVAVRKYGKDFAHLSIKRIDREPIHDWRDLQTIKNALVGVECEGIELYPAESRRIDGANQYHLWCSTSPLFRFPVGWSEGRQVRDAVEGTKLKQRKLA